MSRIESGAVPLEYDTLGNPTDPAVLLIMGLGAQMIFWEEGFCTEIADRGYHVIRFDNRDVGLSGRLATAGVPDVQAAFMKALSGQPVEAPYLIRDMAADAIYLLHELGIDDAHFVGASMGGMIAQTAAFEHPEKVLSLTSIMSTTGEPDLPPPSPEAMEALVTRPPDSSKEEYVEAALRTWRIIGSPKWPREDDDFRKVIENAWDRGYDPDGVARQLVAVLASGGRKAALADVKAPTVVIHGEDDPLVPLACGQATAEAIPNAKLVTIPGMGHDLPPQVWGRIVDEIDAIAKSAAA